MAHDLMTSRFEEMIKKIDEDSAFELFLIEFQRNKGKIVQSFKYVSDKLNIGDPSIVAFLYRKNDWAMKIIEYKTQDALAKQVLAQNTWLQDSDNLYELGQKVIDELMKDFNEKGKIPFNIELIKEDPRAMDRFIKIMETLAHMKMSGNESVIKTITINQQHNETNIDSISSVDSNKINDILEKEGHIQKGEFKLKDKKCDENE